MSETNKPLELLAPAKLNLTLDVLFRHENGYHELDMLMIGVSLYDTLTIAAAGQTVVTYQNMDKPDGDTVSRAASAYAQRAGKACGARIGVFKRIPSEAGLGGGSADAAAALIGLQRLYGALSQDAMREAALEVGADVPYCLQSDACRAGGIGERLIFLRVSRTPLWFVLVKPERGISTRALFGALKLPVRHPNTAKAQAALVKGDVAALGPLLQNAMQPAAEELLPQIGTLCARMKEYGALGGAMTGAGSAVFGLFASEKEARAAAACFSDMPFCCVVKSIGGREPEMHA